MFGFFQALFIWRSHAATLCELRPPLLWVCEAQVPL